MRRVKKGDGEFKTRDKQTKVLPSCLCWAIPFYIHTPPMEEVSQNLPLRNQRSKVPTRAPLQKLPKFSFPLRKKPIFFQTPSEIFKRSKAPTQRFRNDDQGPLRISLPSGGVDIKWNSPFFIIITDFNARPSTVKQ